MGCRCDGRRSLALAAAPLDEVVGAGLLAVDPALLTTMRSCCWPSGVKVPSAISMIRCNAGRRLALNIPIETLPCVAQPKPSARCVAYFLLVQYSPGTEPPDGQRARKAGHQVPAAALPTLPLSLESEGTDAPEVLAQIVDNMDNREDAQQPQARTMISQIWSRCRVRLYCQAFPPKLFLSCRTAEWIPCPLDPQCGRTGRAFARTEIMTAESVHSARTNRNTAAWGRSVKSANSSKTKRRSTCCLKTAMSGLQCTS